MKTLLSIGFALLSIITFGCDCDDVEPSLDSIFQSEGTYIFTGKVIDSKLSSTFYEEQREIKTYYQEVTLEIIESFKGDTLGRVTIINESWSDCGVRFEMNKEYLIYPFKHQKFGNFMVHKCYRRIETSEHSRNEIERLRELIEKNGG